MSAVRIMGIDPGLRRTGWGLIESAGANLSFVAAGTIRPPDDQSVPERLAHLFSALCEAIDALAPNEAAVEQTFVNKDARATLKLGQARGVVLLAPARAGLAVAEYAPNAVKKSVVGAGHADKAQIRAMLRVLLPRATPDSEDAADALAIAVTHAHHRGAVALLAGAVR